MILYDYFALTMAKQVEGLDMPCPLRANIPVGSGLDTKIIFYYR